MEIEKILSSLFSGCGVLMGFMFGNIPYALTALMFFVLIDYLTGVVTAIHEKRLNPAVGFMGIAKKIFVFCMVALAHILDMVLNQTVLMSGVIFFYLAMEGFSIFKNFVILGVPVPSAMIKVLEGFPKK